MKTFSSSESPISFRFWVMEFERVNMNPNTGSPIPIRQALARSATAPPTKSLSRRSLSTSPPPSAPFTTKYFFMNNNNYEGGTGHVHRSNQRRALNSRFMSDAGPGAALLRPVLSQQQAEARNLMLNEIKALQLRRQGSFKRMLRLPMWGSGMTSSKKSMVNVPDATKVHKGQIFLYFLNFHSINVESSI